MVLHNLQGFDVLSCALDLFMTDAPTRLLLNLTLKEF